MPKYTVWTNATDEKEITAQTPGDAAGKYHKAVGDMPEKWDGQLFVRDEEADEVITFRRREAA
jgi:hypothetical protein